MKTRELAGKTIADACLNVETGKRNPAFEPRPTLIPGLLGGPVFPQRSRAFAAPAFRSWLAAVDRTCWFIAALAPSRKPLRTAARLPLTNFGDSYDRSGPRGIRGKRGCCLGSAAWTAFGSKKRLRSTRKVISRTGASDARSRRAASSVPSEGSNTPSRKGAGKGERPRSATTRSWFEEAD